MKIRVTLLVLLSFALSAAGQKKPLDHGVYDAWEAMGDRRISDDGNWIAYVTDVQEGDGRLTVVRADGSERRVYPRGYGLAFSPDSRMLVFRIRAPYAQTRQARIRKVRPDDMPRDSLAILLLGTDSLVRYARVKGYRMPQDDREGWLAVHFEKAPADSAARSKKAVDSGRAAAKDAMGESLPIAADAVTSQSVMTVPDNQSSGLDAEGDDAAGGSSEGTDLMIRHLPSGVQYQLPSVSDFIWNRSGRILVVKGTASRSRPGSRNTVSVWRSLERTTIAACRRMMPAVRWPSSPNATAPPRPSNASTNSGTGAMATTPPGSPWTATR
jgi:hypothetical protein